MTTKVSFVKVEGYVMRLEIEMTVASWRLIRDAIEKGQRGYYGPERQLYTDINDAIGKLVDPVTVTTQTKESGNSF